MKVFYKNLMLNEIIFVSCVLILFRSTNKYIEKRIMIEILIEKLSVCGRRLKNAVEYYNIID